MLEFKLNMYFEEYKDRSLPNRDEFRKNFKKKHGKFQYLNELIRMIETYQIKTYGQTLPRDNYIGFKTKREREREKIKAYNRLRGRLGKWEEKHLKTMIVISNSTMKWEIKSKY